MKRGEGATITRREAATLLRLHPDSVSRALADGLLFAVTSRGGRGKTMRLDRQRVLDWQAARACRRGRGGRRCLACSVLLDVSEFSVEHIEDEGHLLGQCDECSPPSTGLIRPHDERWLRSAP